MRNIGGDEAEEVGISSRDVKHGKHVQYIFYGIWASAKTFQKRLTI